MRYPWWERWGDLSIRAHDTPTDYVTNWLDHGAWFIERYAEDAEPFGWRPVHILHPSRGLMWRWRNLSFPPIALTPSAILARWHPRTANLSFAYAPDEAGTVSILTGQQREAALAQS